MQCFHCKKDIKMKSWLHLTDIPDVSDVSEDESIIVTDKHICGYSCYKRLTESKSLPNNLWSHIVNKEDYEGLLRPIMTQSKKSFEYLTASEIHNLDDSEKEKYFKEKDEQIEINPLLKEVRDELFMEDERTAYLEQVSSDSDYIDDY